MLISLSHSFRARDLKNIGKIFKASAEYNVSKIRSSPSCNIPPPPCCVAVLTLRRLQKYATVAAVGARRPDVSFVLCAAKQHHSSAIA